MEVYLCLSFVNETRIISVVEDLEMIEVPENSFNTEVTTLYCATICNGMIVQVTNQSARFINADTLQLVKEWFPTYSDDNSDNRYVYVYVYICKYVLFLFCICFC